MPHCWPLFASPMDPSSRLRSLDGLVDQKVRLPVTICLFVSIYEKSNVYKFTSSFKQWCLTLGLIDTFENQTKVISNKPFPPQRKETHTLTNTPTDIHKRI